jgi:hypothetical protein
MNVSAAARAPALNASSLPASGGGTISGQFFVRMVISGVITPCRP